MSSESRQRRAGNDRPEGSALKRRDFIKAGGAVAGAAGLPGLAAAAATGEAPEYPSVDVARLADLAPGASVPFRYPDARSPALLLRLDGPAENGVGEDASVVAFSTLCTHKGCAVAYKPE